MLAGVALAGHGWANNSATGGAGRHGTNAYVAGAEADGIVNAPEKNTKIRLLFDGKEMVIILEDNPASRNLVSLLPLTLTFEDYNGTEKISYLPEKLQTRGAPASCVPTAGSFAYYAPWGNLALFYRDFRHSNGLVPLGRVESGMEKLARLSGDFSARLEKME